MSWRGRITQHEIVRLSAVRLHVRLLLDQERIGEAIEIIALTYMADPDAVAALPLQRALEKGLELDGPFKRQIPWAIVLDLGLTHVAKKYRRHRSYAVEDIWEAYCLERPSDLGNFITPANQALMVHYLRYLCVSDVLGDTAAFLTIPELEEERIKVLHLLSEIDGENARLYLEEIKTISRWLVIYSEFRRFDGSRLYVDRDGLTTDLRAKLGREFDRMLALRREQAASGDLSEIVLHAIRPYKHEELGAERVVLTYAFDNPLKILENLLENVAREFKSNSYFGLDVYLSTRIRHGTLKGYLRSPLEEQNLICQQSSGEYLDQAHWAERAQTWKTFDYGIQQVLKPFSVYIDESIQSLNETALRVKAADKDGWIDVSFDADDVKRFAILLDNFESDADFFALAVAQMVAKLEALLPTIKQRLESGPRVQWSTRIGELRAEVPRIAEPMLAQEFDAAITKSQLGTDQAFQAISGWFTMSKGHSSPDYEIDLAIDIALKSIESCFGEKAITYRRDGASSPVFEGRTLTAMVDIFFLLFENVYRHARDESDDCPPAVMISVIYDDPIFCVSVRNLVPVCKDWAEVELKLLAARASLALSQHDQADQIVKEGGSGFLKLQKILTTDLKLKTPDFDFYLSGNGFDVNFMFDITGMTV